MIHITHLYLHDTVIPMKKRLKSWRLLRHRALVFAGMTSECPWKSSNVSPVLSRRPATHPVRTTGDSGSLQRDCFISELDGNHFAAPGV